MSINPILYFKDFYFLFFVTYSFVLASLNVLAVSNPLYGYLAILLFHVVAAITLIHGKQLSLLVLLLFITLGTEIGGAVTTDFSSDFTMINVSSARVPFLDISLAILYSLVLTVWVLFSHKISAKNLITVLAILPSIFTLGLINPIGQLFHSIQIVIMLIMGYLFGPYLFTQRAVRTILVCVWVTFICFGVASILGYQRPYSVESFAFTGGFHNYIFLLPFLTFHSFRNQGLAFCGVLIAYFSSGFLISGKIIVTFIISLICLLGYRLGAILFSCLCFSLFSGQFIQITADFLVSSGNIIAGEKLRQLDLMTNLYMIPEKIFYNSSAGNIIAEATTLGRHILFEGYLLGTGLGASLPDYYGYLSLANDGAYPAQEFDARAMSRMHVAIFNFILWFGFVAIILATYLMRKAASFGPLAVTCLVFSMIYATTKFDLIVFGALIYFLLSPKSHSFTTRNKLRLLDYKSSID